MNFDIGDLNPNTPHLFADLAELVLMVGYNGRNYLHKNDLEGVIDRGVISPEELDEEADAASTSEAINETGAERNERRERQLEDVLTQLAFRSKAMEGFYPFEVEGEFLKIRENLTSKHRVYKLLLACSRLRSFKESGINQLWAKAFTKLSKIAMKGLVPNHAEVRIFDANSEDRTSYYSTNLKEALKILGKDLAVRIDEIECDKAGTSGDGGLDLVAIVNFDDGARTSYALLGQCGAQEKNWPKKTLEAHSIRYKNFFHMIFELPGVMFTPVCYRNSDGEWSNVQSANGILLVDRIRMLKLIEAQNCWDDIISNQWFIDFEFALSKVVAPN